MDSRKYTATPLVAFVTRVAKSFFGIHKDDTSSGVQKKVAETIFHRVIYSLADYWLMFVSGLFIIMMDRQFGYGPVALFILMWAFDLIVANIFVVLWKRTGKDVTLGESYRRAADTIAHSSRIGGYIAFAGVVLKACFWDGPEHIVIFFNKEIKTELRMFVILLLLTAIQAAIWTPIYVLGFDTGVELFQYMKNLFFEVH